MKELFNWIDNVYIDPCYGLLACILVGVIYWNLSKEYRGMP